MPWLKRVASRWYPHSYAPGARHLLTFCSPPGSRWAAGGHGAQPVDPYSPSKTRIAGRPRPSPPAPAGRVPAPRPEVPEDSIWPRPPAPAALAAPAPTPGGNQRQDPVPGGAHLPAGAGHAPPQGAARRPPVSSMRSSSAVEALVGSPKGSSAEKGARANHSRGVNLPARDPPKTRPSPSPRLSPSPAKTVDTSPIQDPTLSARSHRYRHRRCKRWPRPAGLATSVHGGLVRGALLGRDDRLRSSSDNAPAKGGPSPSGLAAQRLRAMFALAQAHRQAAVERGRGFRTGRRRHGVGEGR